MQNYTPLVAKATVTVATNGASLDVSGITGDYHAFLRITNLVGIARFVFEDSVTAFAASLAGPTFSVQGDLKADFPVTLGFTRREFPSLRVGIPSGVLRLTLAELTGTGKTCTYEAFIES